jgi:hypothetical protein
MRMMIVVVVGLGGLCLAACSPAVTPTAPPTAAATLPPTRTTPPTATPVAAAANTPQPDEGLVIYHKSGCFTGIDETLEVRADGTLVFTDTRGATQSTQVAVAQLQPLHELLAQPEFAELQPMYKAVGADLCTYTLTVKYQDKSFSVTTMDGAETPEVLRQALSRAAQLRDEFKTIY